MIRRYVVTATLDGNDVLSLYLDEHGGHHALDAAYVIRCHECGEPVGHTVGLRSREVLPAVSGGTHEVA